MSELKVDQDVFGLYCKIPTGVNQEKYIYKIISSFRSNAYCETPIMPNSKIIYHNGSDLIPVLNVVRCGIDETEIIRVALKDCEVLPSKTEKKCQKCGYDNHYILINIQDATGELTLCPNCVVRAICDGELHFINDIHLNDDITGKAGAVKYTCGDEKYILDKDTMIRLLARNLKPDEHAALVEEYSWNNYLLHEDFYDANNVALQPIILDFMKVLLIKTDGYSISVNGHFTTLANARAELKKQYNDAIPDNGLTEEWKELSYCCDDDAILYANGDNVYVWKIITIK